MPVPDIPPLCHVIAGFTGLLNLAYHPVPLAYCRETGNVTTCYIARPTCIEPAVSDILPPLLRTTTPLHVSNGNRLILRDFPIDT